MLRRGTSLVLDFVPGIGSLKSGAQALTGADILTGQAVDRTDEVTGIVLGVIPFGKVLSKVGKMAAKAGSGMRNSHLAGSVHPKTGVPFDKNGFPDFSKVCKAEVKIAQTGTRAGDFRLANKAAGLERTPEGYTWHHHQDGTTMQLVPRDIHAQTGHTGGFIGEQ